MVDSRHAANEADACGGAPRLIDARQAQQPSTAHEHCGHHGPDGSGSRPDKALRVELTVDDPTFHRTLNANVTYRCPRGFNEGVCAENNVDMFHQGDLKLIPQADRPDF